MNKCPIPFHRVHVIFSIIDVWVFFKKKKKNGVQSSELSDSSMFI
jgi:hypothetical protein